MAKNRPADPKVEDEEMSEGQDDKYGLTSPSIKKELEQADKERGPKAPGVTE